MKLFLLRIGTTNLEMLDRKKIMFETSSTAGILIWGSPGPLGPPLATPMGTSSRSDGTELSSIFFAGTVDRNPFIRFAAASFFGSDWLNKQQKNSSLLLDSTSLSLSPLSLLALLVHSSTC